MLKEIFYKKDLIDSRSYLDTSIYSNDVYTDIFKVEFRDGYIWYNSAKDLSDATEQACKQYVRENGLNVKWDKGIFDYWNFWNSWNLQKQNRGTFLEWLVMNKEFKREYPKSHKIACGLYSEDIKIVEE